MDITNVHASLQNRQVHPTSLNETRRSTFSLVSVHSNGSLAQGGKSWITLSTTKRHSRCYRIQSNPTLPGHLWMVATDETDRWIFDAFSSVFPDGQPDPQT